MELVTEIDVDATPERVWAVLTDFDRYDEWNPFMRVVGRANEGARLDVELRPPGGRAVRFRPTVTHAERGRELRWLGHLYVVGLYDGEHRFTLEPLDGGRTRFVHAESFGGVLAGIVNRVVGESTERGFRAMNEALKARVESLHPDDAVATGRFEGAAGTDSETGTGAPAA